MKPKIFFCAFLALVLLALARPAAAQNSNIQGQVTDPQGAVIPDAQVTARNIATGVIVTATSNSAGLYLIPSLQIGEYRVEASKQGFGAEVRDKVRLDVNQSVQINFALQLGHVTQTVTVKSTGEVLNTVTSTVSQTISNRQVVDLPLNGRNYLQLGLLTPDTTPAYGSRHGPTGAFSAIGQDAAQFSIVLDGASNSSIQSGGEVGYQAQAVTPPIDAINEFAVVTNNNAPEYGLRMGATVVASLKSGTNQLHGDGWEFFRNQDISAANFFSVSKPKPALKYNQFGGTIGGPIRKDKTFFFVSYQGTRNHSGTTSIGTVPTAAELTGNFSGGYKTIFDPTTTVVNPNATVGGYVRTAFQGNIITPSYFDKVAQNVIKLYPLPNYGSGIVNNYYFSGHAYDDADEVDSRFDHNFSSNNRLYVHYSHRSESILTPGSLPYPADGGASQLVGLTAHSGVVGWTSTISPTLVNDLNLSLLEFPTNMDIPWTQNLNAQLGITGVTPNGAATNHGMTLLSSSGYASLGPPNFWPNINFLDDQQMQDKLMWSHGRHMMKFGIGYLRYGTDRVATRYSRGNMSFNGSFTQDPQHRGTTGDGFADLLLGMAGGGNIGNVNGETAINSNYSGFAQDTFQATKRLSLTLGVRWDLMEPPHFLYHQNVSRFDPFYGTPNYGKFEYPTGDSDTGTNWNYHNFAPRVGFAYQATQNTVIRSGFGLFYGITDSFISQDSHWANEPPQFTEISFPTDQLFSPALTLATGFPAGLLPTTTIRPNVAVYTGAQKQPDQYSEEWFFEVQRELTPNTVLTVAYTGNGSHFLTVYHELNQPLVPAAGAVQGRRPWPQFSSVRINGDPLANANYNALSVKLEHRYARSLTLLTSYTFSDTIGNAVEVNDTAPGQGVENNYNFQNERAKTTFNLPNVFITSAVYDLPFGNGHRFLDTKGVVNGVLGGWRLGGIVTIESGNPFSPAVSSDLINEGTTNRPNGIGNGNLPRGQRSIADWFNVAAFSIPAAYTYGTASRNCLYGPGIVNLDLNLAKSYNFSESKRLEVRAEAFNFTNTPHFGVPANNVNLTGAGTITGAGAPRQVQLALKFYF